MQVATSGLLEEVCVRLTINPWPQDLEGFLYGQVELVAISLTGTRSLLAYRNAASQQGPESMDWTFTSHAIWGEEAGGVWKIIVSHPNPASSWDSSYKWGGVEIITRSGQLIPASVMLARAGVVPNHFAFVVTGPVNQPVAIESSSDLASWTPLQTNALSGGRFTFTDPDLAGLTNRFFRARTVNASADSSTASPASWKVILPLSNVTRAEAQSRPKEPLPSLGGGGIPEWLE